MKINLEVSQKLKNSTTLLPSSTTPRHIPKGLPPTLRDINHTHDFSWFAHNIKEMDPVKMTIRDEWMMKM